MWSAVVIMGERGVMLSWWCWAVEGGVDGAGRQKDLDRRDGIQAVWWASQNDAKVMTREGCTAKYMYEKRWARGSVSEGVVCRGREKEEAE